MKKIVIFILALLGMLAPPLRGQGGEGGNMRGASIENNLVNCLNFDFFDYNDLNDYLVSALIKRTKRKQKLNIPSTTIKYKDEEINMSPEFV